MNLTITQDNTRTEILGSEGSSLAHKLYEIASDQNNTVSLTGSISVPYAYADEVEYLNTNFGPNFNITAGGTWIKFYHQEIEDAIMSWASYNPNNVGANFASTGHITQADADSITSWGKTFTGNTNITQFNEFEKFRNVTQVSQNDCFQGCTNLQSIKLPPRLTNIRGWMFNGCTSLSGIILPASCTTIDSSGFANCTSLTSIDLSNVTTIGNNAFQNCSNLSLNANILQNLTNIGQRAFDGCSGVVGVLNCPNLTQIGFHSICGTNITSITNLGSVNTLTEGTLTCDSLTNITLPSTLRIVSWGFCNTSNNIEKIIFPEGVTDIINQQPNMLGLKYIEIPSTVVSIGACFHRALERNVANSCYMVIKATTPPDLIFYADYLNVESSGYDLHAFAGIYVPDSALSTYRDTENLSNAQIGWKVAAVQAKLKPISDLQADSPTWWAEYQTRVNS